jgi:hypothetical protein
MSFDRIDFAPNPPPRLALWAATALLAGLAAWGGLRYLQAQQATAQARSQAQSLRALLTRQAASTHAPAPAWSREQLKAVNEAVTALNVPWPAVLGAMEASRTPAVMLVRVEPRPKDERMLITAQADEMDSLVAYMRQMARTAPFVKVTPVRQEVLTDAGPHRKQATFEARWEDRP